jgi:hypothetical protein
MRSNGEPTTVAGGASAPNPLVRPMGFARWCRARVVAGRRLRQAKVAEATAEMEHIHRVQVAYRDVLAEAREQLLDELATLDVTYPADRAARECAAMDAVARHAEHTDRVYAAVWAHLNG